MGTTGSFYLAERQQKKEAKLVQKRRNRVLNQLYSVMTKDLTNPLLKLGEKSKQFAKYFDRDRFITYSVMFNNDEIIQYQLSEDSRIRWQVCILMARKILDCIDHNVSDTYLGFLARETIQYMWNMVFNEDITKTFNETELLDFCKKIKETIGETQSQDILVEHKIIREVILSISNLPGNRIVELSNAKWNIVSENLRKRVDRGSSVSNDKLADDKLIDSSPPEYHAEKDQVENDQVEKNHVEKDQPPSYDVEKIQQNQTKPSAPNQEIVL